MNPITLQKCAENLRKLLVQLQNEIDRTTAESAPVAVDGSMGRVSRGDAIQVQQLALEMKRRREDRIIRVQSALNRIEQGTYGLCGRCRDPIDQARLEALPEVVLCVCCASASNVR